MTRLIWLFGAALVACGLLLLSALAGFVARPAIAAPLLELLSALPPAWRSPLHVAAALAASGVGLGALGVLITRRQAGRLRRERMREQDRLRRVHVYRAEARREPYIGPGLHDGRTERRRHVA